MRTYQHLDVFTDRMFFGNQLAVFLDGGGLAPELMQQIAKELNYSETTFVMDAEAPGTDVRVRIFTPGTELPMAGHPTIGTAFAMAEAGRLRPGQAEVTFGLGVGPTPVRLEWDGGRLSFAWMRQAVPTFGRQPRDVDALAAALGVTPRDIRDTNLPVEEASAGVPFLYVPMTTTIAVDRAVPDVGGLKRFFEAESMPELPVFVFSLDTGSDDITAYSRMFAPGLGVLEDPATGSASGPLGGYLFHHGAVTADRARAMISLQGVKMGRESRIHIAVTATDLAMTDVQIGGRAVTVGSGTVAV